MTETTTAKQIALGKKLKQLRKKENLTLEDVGKALKKSKGAVLRAEAGEYNMTLKQIVLFAKFYDITLSELFKQTGNE